MSSKKNKNSKSKSSKKGSKKVEKKSQQLSIKIPDFSKFFNNIKEKFNKKPSKSKDGDEKNKESGKSENKYKTLALQIVAWTLVFTFTFMLVDYLIQYLNKDYSAAVVNGQRVSDSKIKGDLVKLVGEEYLAREIDELLVRNAADTEGIEGSEKLAESFLKEVEKQSPQNFVGQSDFQKKQLVDEFAMNIRIYKILNGEPTDEELDEYAVENNDLLTNLLGEEFTIDNEFFRANYILTKLDSSDKESYLQGLRDEAVIQNNYEQEINYEIFGATQNIVENLTRNE